MDQGDRLLRYLSRTGNIQADKLHNYPLVLSSRQLISFTIILGMKNLFWN